MQNNDCIAKCSHVSRSINIFLYFYPNLTHTRNPIAQPLEWLPIFWLQTALQAIKLESYGKTSVLG